MWWVVTPLNGLEADMKGPFADEQIARGNARLGEDADGVLVGKPQLIEADSAEQAQCRHIGHLPGKPIPDTAPLRQRCPRCGVVY